MIAKPSVGRGSVGHVAPIEDSLEHSLAEVPRFSSCIARSTHAIRRGKKLASQSADGFAEGESIPQFPAGRRPSTPRMGRATPGSSAR
jgi:hypothetical protein